MAMAEYSDEERTHKQEERINVQELAELCSMERESSYEKERERAAACD